MSTPVTDAEKAYVKQILARMESSGQVLSPRVVNTHSAMGSMTDASKRLRSGPGSPGLIDSDDDQGPVFPVRDGFQVIPTAESEAKPKAEPKALMPTPKPKTTPGYDGTLPPGVGSMSQWGKTICNMPKVKAEAPSYAEIATLEKYAEYRFWVCKQSLHIKTGRCADLRAYLMAVGVEESSFQVVSG